MTRLIKTWVPVSLVFAAMLLMSCWPLCPRCPEDPKEPKQGPSGETNLSPPIVNAPLYQCATALTVQGFVPGATIDIYADVTTHIGGGTSDSPWGQSFSVNPDLVAGQKITATQTYGSVTSQPSEPVDVVDYFQLHPEGLTKPVQDEPIYNCGGALGVRNLVEGGLLEVFADGDLVGSANGCGAGQWVFINPNFSTGQKIQSVETLCNRIGPKSDAVAVQTEPSSLPSLTVGDIYEGGTRVVVRNITNGALVAVFNGSQQVAGHHCSGGGQIFRLDPVPLVGDILTATQSLCDVTSDPSKPSTVQPCRELPAPTVHAICIEDTYITVSGTAPDAHIRVYSNGALIGNGGGNNIVPITPIVVGMVITATQSLGDCVSPVSAPVTIANYSAPTYEPDVWNNLGWVVCNNCYNYACDIRTDNFAQPGYAHGAPIYYDYDGFRCDEVSLWALADGLTSGEKGCDGCTTHRVALFVDNSHPDYDYHWYRLDDNGTWSNKPSYHPATDLDASGNIMTNPRTADRHYIGPDYDLDYTYFCGYYCVDKDVVVIKGSRPCRK